MPNANNPVNNNAVNTVTTQDSKTVESTERTVASGSPEAKVNPPLSSFVPIKPQVAASAQATAPNVPPEKQVNPPLSSFVPKKAKNDEELLQSLRVPLHPVSAKPLIPVHSVVYHNMGETEATSEKPAPTPVKPVVQPQSAPKAPEKPAPVKPVAQPQPAPKAPEKPAHVKPVAQPQPAPKAPEKPAPTPVKPVEQPQPVPKASEKPAPAPVKPVAQPQFVPKASAKPASAPEKPVAQTQPVPKASEKPAPAPVKPVAQPQLVPKAPAKPASAPEKPVAQTQPVPKASEKPAPAPVKPVVQPQPVPKASEKPTPAPVKPVEQPQPVPKASEKPAPTPVKPVAQPQPAPKASEKPAPIPVKPVVQPQPAPKAPEKPASASAKPQVAQPAPQAPVQPAPVKPQPVRPTVPPVQPTTTPVQPIMQPQPAPKAPVTPAKMVPVAQTTTASSTTEPEAQASGVPTTEIVKNPNLPPVLSNIVNLEVMPVISWFRRLPFAGQVFILCVALPTFLSFFYFQFIASDMYVTETKFAIRSSSSESASLSLASQVFKMPGASSSEALIIEEYLKSYDAFKAIDEPLKVREHYAQHEFDMISRLSDKATIQDLTEFWQKISAVEVNQDSGVITFSVRAYTPEKAQEIAKKILEESEQLVNGMNERARDDTLRLAKHEVDEAQKKLTKAQETLKEFRSFHRDLDLKTTASGFQNVILDLEKQAAIVRAEIAQKLQYMRSDSPEILTLQSKLDGFEAQIKREKAMVTEVSESGSSINSLAGQYERLELESEFAKKQFEYALTSLESAKLQLLSKSLYVVTIAEPSLPDESLYPKPFLFSFYIFIALSMITLMSSVIVAAIKEHMGF